MNEFENELRKALCRREPPPGFSDRVMARVPRKPNRLPWMAALAAALVLVMAGISFWHQERERQRRVAAEKAKAELIYALQVTASGLETAKAMLQRQVGGKRI
jgi:hypothetical protein